MPLTGPQIDRIQKAILDAFDRPELRRVVRIGINERLEEIASDSLTFKAQVFELIVWADRNRRVVQLLKCVHEDRKSDSALATLYAESQTWVEPVAAAPLPTPPTGPYQIFLSYSHKDAAIKDRLLADLHSAGYRVWTDDGLQPGTEEWKRAIKQAILGCKCMVAILTPDAEQSKWVNIEIDYAIEWNRLVIPLLARGERRDAVPLALFGAQYVDLRTDYTGQVSGKLLPALRKHLGVSTPPSQPLPSRIEVPLPAPAPPADEILALVARMQDVTVPATDRLEAGLRAADLGDVPPDLDTFIAVPGHNFRVGKYPVTNAQFRRFMDAGGYNEQRWWSGYGLMQKRSWNYTEPRFWHDSRFNRPTQPVMGVSAFEVQAYCNWLSSVRIGLNEGETARWPTVAEWMVAARSGRPAPQDDAQDYPWHGPFDLARANTGHSSLNQTTPVHMYPNGSTPELGVCDLIGNTSECAEGVFIVGGDYLSMGEPISAVMRNADPDYPGRLGIRVVVVPDLL